MFSFHNPTLSVGNAAYLMPTSKSGSWQKLVPIACRLSDHVTMAATMKGAQFRAKRMTLSAEIEQVLNLQISLHPVCIHDQHSDCVCDVFNLLCGPLHLASECSSQGGFVLVVSTFFYFCRGLFYMQHCCTVIMLGLWLS